MPNILGAWLPLHLYVTLVPAERSFSAICPTGSGNAPRGIGQIWYQEPRLSSETGITGSDIWARLLGTSGTTYGLRRVSNTHAAETEARVSEEVGDEIEFNMFEKPRTSGVALLSV